MLYDNQPDAERYLMHSWVLYNGHPYIVQGVAQVPIKHEMTCALAPHEWNPEPFNTVVNVNITDPQLSMLNFNLGYVNLTSPNNRSSTACYVARLPVRGAGYKQGLHENNLELTFCTPMRNPARFRDIQRNIGFAHMCINKYPSLREATAFIAGLNVPSSMAFNRQLAVSFDPELEDFTFHYRGDPIGRAEDAAHFRLPKSKRYLSEVLEANGVKLV